jgi:thioredoxin reductase (NADPH)
MNNYDVIVIGGGVSGLTSSIYTSRSFLKTLNIAGFPAGGQLMWTTEVENFPGFPDGVMGPELIERMRNQAIKFGTEFLDENVTSITGSAEEGFKVKSEGGSEFTAKSLIVSVGSSPKKLGATGEDRLSARGVSYCAVCDGAFFKEKAVAVVGGGDSAMEEAGYLSKYASQVYVLVRGTEDQMRASAIMIERAKKNPKIKFLFNTQVKEIKGEKMVESLDLIHADTNSESNLPLQGVFVAIGWKPNTDFLGSLVEKDALGYINVTNHTNTSVKGIFVCGDAADARYRQAITAAGTGAMAAIDCERYLSH